MAIWAALTAFRLPMTAMFICEGALRFGHVRWVADSGTADKAVRASANCCGCKPFESLRLKHDKVRNEFEAHCLVQHQVPRLSRWHRVAAPSARPCRPGWRDRVP